MPSCGLADAVVVRSPTDPCVSGPFVWAAIVLISLTIWTPVQSTGAATIERFSLRHAGAAVEVVFAVQGPTPRWQLNTHAQELWLDLRSCQIARAAERVPAAFFPLMGVRTRDFGGGRVRLIIEVRGRVDYAVAQMPNELVVRIAPWGQAADWAQPLLAEMEQDGASTNQPAAIPGSASKSSPPVFSAVDEHEHAGSAHPSTQSLHPDESAAVLVTTMPAVADSVKGSAPAPATPPARISLASPGVVDTRPTVAPGLQPVSRPLTNPWLGPDRIPPLVVIDAGHGGFDPGTESADGIVEKNVALEIAQRLAAGLHERGIDTRLTRDDDQFLSLGQRTALANRAHADLFVSIHLNSSPDGNTSGIETYYLNNTSDRATIRLASMENEGEYGDSGSSHLHYILANLRQDYKALESSSLARMIEAEAADSVATLGLTVNALGAKRGPFYVLVGAEMPSVLVECGFLSNRREARLLLQASYQTALAGGIAAAIVDYFHADLAVGNL